MALLAFLETGFLHQRIIHLVGDFQTLIAICCNSDKAIATKIYQHWFKCHSVHHKLGSQIWGG